MDPRGNKGTKTNCLKRLVCVERQELCQDFYGHNSKLDQTRLQGPLIVSGNSTFHFISM